MIWVTGDKHGQLDAFEEPQYKKLKKRDTLIVCGDFGFLWDDSKQEKKNLQWLSKRRYNIAFVDGCHENYHLLAQCPCEDWQGGTVRRVAPNVVQLMRGEVYQIDGTSILSFGGGESKEKDEDARGVSWFEEEAPSDEQIQNVVENIKRANGTVDFVLSHEAPYSIQLCMETDRAGSEAIHDLLEQIRTHCQFRRWFFGKYHIDKTIPPFYRAVFNDLVPLE